MGNCYPLAHRGGYKVNAVTGFTAATWESGTVCVYWTAPADHYSGVMVRYKLGAYPVSPTDGDLLGDGAGGSLELSYQNYVNGFLKSGLTVGNTYYISAFSYAVSAGGSRHYSKTIAHAVWTAETIQPGAGGYSGSGGNISGIGYAFYTDGVYTVPAGIRALDVFCIGGGGSGGAQYIVTSEDMDGQAQSGNAGGTTSFGAICTAGGGAGGQGGATTYGAGVGGAGGSGGGGGGAAVSGQTFGGDGGSNGAGGTAGYNGRSGGAGQGTSTHAFGGSAGIAYSGGGGGSFNGNGGATGGGNGDTSGTANTGGGGGGGSYSNGASGGSGIVIIRRAA